MLLIAIYQSGTVSKEVSVDFKWNLPFHTLFSQPKTTILNYKQDVHIYYQYTSCASKWQLGFGDAERHQDTVVPQITWLETTKHTDVKVKLTMNVLLLQTSNYMQYNDTKFSAADHCVSIKSNICDLENVIAKLNIIGFVGGNCSHSKRAHPILPHTNRDWSLG